MLVLVLVLIHLSGLQLSAAITSGQQATALMAVDLRLAQAERALTSSAAWFSMRLQAASQTPPLMPPLIPEFLLQASWLPVSCPAHLTAGLAEPNVTHCLQLQLTVRHQHHSLERSLTVIYGWDEAEQLRFAWPLRG